MSTWDRWIFMRSPLLSFSLSSSCYGAYEIQDSFKDGKASYRTMSKALTNYFFLVFLKLNFHILFGVNSVKISDATPGVIIIVIAYVLPARPTFWCLKTGNKKIDRKPSASVLDWKYTQRNFPWNALLLLGIKIRRIRWKGINLDLVLYLRWWLCSGWSY